MKMAVRALSVAVLLALGAGRAAAGTADGVLITNIAAGTFSSAGGIRFYITYATTAWVLVQNPKIVMWKTASPTMQAPGGDVTFKACVLNTSADVSAFNVTVTDVLPSGFEFRAGGTVGGNPGIWPNTWVITNANGLAGPWNAGWPAVGQDPVWFLRWTLPVVGQLDSGCVEFTARVL